MSSLGSLNINFPIGNGLTTLLAHACIYSRFWVIRFCNGAIATDQNFLNFMQFFGKSGKFVCWRPPPGGLAPPPTENSESAPFLYLLPGENYWCRIFLRALFLKVGLVFSNDHFCWDQTLFIEHRKVAGKTPLFNPCSKLRQNEQVEPELFELTHHLKYIFCFYYIYAN